VSSLTRFFFIVFILSLFFFSLSKQSGAVSISITGGNSQIKSSDEYSVHVAFSIKVADGTEYYLRGAFAKQGSKKYCGYTWNGNNWFNGPYTNEGWKHFLPITVKNNSWSGDLKAKLDTDNKDCKNPGIYIFKIERFKSSDKGTFDTASEQTVTVEFPPMLTSPPQSQTKNPTGESTEQASTNPRIADSSVSPIASHAVDISEIPSSSFSISMKPAATEEASVLATEAGSISSSVFPTIFQQKKITKVQGITQQSYPPFLIIGTVILFIAGGIGTYQIIRIKKH